MRNRMRALLGLASAIVLMGALVLVGCGSSTNENGESAEDTVEAERIELQIFAANSLSKAMEEAQAAYTEANPNVTFADTQYKGSGELNEMLAAGDQADLLISASKSKMDDADEAGYIDGATRINMFTNDLVIVTSEANEYITEVSLDDVATGNYTVCLGDDSVPAGNYANQSLSTVGCFVDPEGSIGPDSAGKADGTDAYAGTPLEGKVILDGSVGNVCEKAQAGEVDLAFVYSSDVYRFGGVKVVGTVPGDTHKPIMYPGAVCANSANSEAAAAFLKWCMEDPEAAQIWEAWGFTLAAE